MKALITKEYIYTHMSFGTTEQYKRHRLFVEWINNNKGKWVEIDTKYIFENQYNTVDGYRIYDTYIDKITEDIRTDKNVFFVNHPNGKDKIKKVSIKDHLKNERFLFCNDINGNYYRISRRKNIEFIIANGEVYTTNGIGYTPLIKSKLTENEIQIVLYCVDKINKL